MPLTNKKSTASLSGLGFKIPKTLHFVWVGDESKTPLKEIETWKRLNPLYTVKIWGNDDLAGGWMLAKHMKYFAERELCGVADCMRYEILYKYGGIAMDADSTCVRPLPDWLLEPEIWCCWESEVNRLGLLANGAMGSIPKHPLIGQIIQDLSQEEPFGMAWECTGPTRLTKTWHEHEYRDLTIWPSHFFIPDHFAGHPYGGTGPVFATQEWKSTRGQW